MKTALFLLFFVTSSLFAGSVRLINDSPYRLRAVIRGNDSSYLGEVVLNAAHVSTWNDTSGQLGHFGKGNAYQEQSTRSQTPYTVLWYCLEGNADYSVCNMIATGSTVTAQSCQGARQCKPAKKKQSGAFPNQPEGNFLQKQEEQDENAAGPPEGMPSY
ncbi:MAG: hypothetical protein ACHQT8_01720 [Chlamydiales bacterium]